MELELELRKKLSVVRKDDLIELCKKYNLDPSGNKDALISRLIEHKDENGEVVDYFDNASAIVENDNFSDALNVNSHDEMNFLKREMECLKRENELLMREIRLNNREQSGNFITVSRISEYEGLLDDFAANDGENFSAWLTQFNSIRNSYKLDDNSARNLLTKKLKGRALAWLRSKPNHIESTVSNLLFDMGRLFDNRLNKLTRRRVFENRIWKYTETFSEYFYDKIIKANELNIEQDEIIDSIIDGIQDGNLQNQAKSLRFKTPDEFLASFSNVTYKNRNQNQPYFGKNYVTKIFERNNQPYEGRFKNNRVSDQRRDEGKPRVVEQNSKQLGDNLKTDPVKKNTNVTGDNANIRCFNCNVYGHYSNQCPKPKREKGSCYVCGLMGHTFSNCNKNKKNM